MQDLTVDYQYRELEINGKCYCIPIDCDPGSRRWKFWLYWQNLGLPIPECKPKRIIITRTNVLVQV